MKVSSLLRQIFGGGIGACGLTLSLLGCATILKGSNSSVAVQAPQGTTVSENGAPLHQIPGRDGFFLHLRSSRKHNLRFEYLGKEKLVTLLPSIETGWLIADIFYMPFSYIIDASTGDWSSFQNINLFNADFSEPVKIDSVELVEPLKKTVKKWTILLHIGYGFPVFQVPLIFTHIGGGFGYNPIRNAELAIGAESNGFMNFGSKDTVIYIGNATLFTLRAKHTVFGGIFLDAKAAYAKLRLTGAYSRGDLPSSLVPQTSQNLFLIGPGIGFEGQDAFIELQQYFGFRHLHLYGNGQIFQMFTLSIGTHIDF